MLEGEDELFLRTEQKAFLVHDRFSLVFALHQDLEVFDRYRVSRTEVDDDDASDDDVQQKEVQDLVDVRVRPQEVWHLRVKSRFNRLVAHRKPLRERFEEKVHRHAVAGDECEEDLVVAAVASEYLSISSADTPQTDDCSFGQQEGEDDEVADEHEIQDEECVVPLEHAADRVHRNDADEDVAEDHFPEESLLTSDYLDAEESFAVEDPIDVCQYRQETDVRQVAMCVEVLCEEDSELGQRAVL